jgi:hypothetical protein
MAHDSLSIEGQNHGSYKHPEILLLKFDPNKYIPPKYHIKKFMLAVRLMNVQHEDVVCHIFPYTLENKTPTMNNHHSNIHTIVVSIRDQGTTSFPRFI